MVGELEGYLFKWEGLANRTRVADLRGTRPETERMADESGQQEQLQVLGAGENVASWSRALGLGDAVSHHQV